MLLLGVKNYLSNGNQYSQESRISRMDGITRWFKATWKGRKGFARLMDVLITVIGFVILYATWTNVAR